MTAPLRLLLPNTTSLLTTLIPKAPCPWYIIMEVVCVLAVDLEMATKPIGGHAAIAVPTTAANTTRVATIARTGDVGATVRCTSSTDRAARGEDSKKTLSYDVQVSFPRCSFLPSPELTPQSFSFGARSLIDFGMGFSCTIAVILVSLSLPGNPICALIVLYRDVTGADSEQW